ncbi:MAG: site-2 protease family protein [Oscillospiraceae bacterium]|nr:site-2 protease family protein [Oscillospiraceae bacterium]
MIYVIVAILIFGVLIALHEAGHFLAAKACGVRVNEFSVGMGPAIFKKKKGDTLYALRALPVGGYCAMEGEDEASDDPAALNNQGFWRKLFIFAAGAAVNFLAGCVILFFLYINAGGFYVADIVSLHPDFPQQGESGVMVGDRIVAINGERVYLQSDVDLILRAVPLDEDGTITVKLRRGGETLTRTLTLQTYTGEDGEPYRAYGFSYGGVEEANLWVRLKYTVLNAIDFVRTVRLSLQMLITGQAGLQDLSGPVGIVSTITEVGNQSKTAGDAVANIAYFAALIAVNLAVMNLLPLPALDGGRILFLVLNALATLLFRRSIPAKYEGYVHIAGLVLLLGLMAVITFQDVWKLFS